MSYRTYFLGSSVLPMKDDTRRSRPLSGEFIYFPMEEMSVSLCSVRVQIVLDYELIEQESGGFYSPHKSIMIEFSGLLCTLPC